MKRDISLVSLQFGNRKQNVTDKETRQKCSCQPTTHTFHSFGACLLLSLYFSYVINTLFVLKISAKKKSINIGEKLFQ